MATNPLPRPITVDEFRSMPEPRGDFAWELHYGELVPVTRPKLKHSLLQQRLTDLLRPLTPSGSYLWVEVAFRPVPEFDLRCADVAWVSPERWVTAREQDDIPGAPDLVIEVRSPSNTVREISDKRMLCLTHGSQEFWLIDEENKRIDVTRQNGETHSYRPGDTIPLPLFGPDKSVQVDLIFSSEA